MLKKVSGYLGNFYHNILSALSGNKKHANICFLFGLSATGKTHFARYIAARNDWIHIEIDQAYGKIKGLELYGFQDEWNDFITTGDLRSLIKKIYAKMVTEQKSGAILTFPSGRFLDLKQIENLNKSATVLYFTGDPELCINSFLEREKKIGRNLPVSYWHDHNTQLLKYMSSHGMDKWTIDVFNENGKRKTENELLTLTNLAGI